MKKYLNLLLGSIAIGSVAITAISTAFIPNCKSEKNRRKELHFSTEQSLSSKDTAAIIIIQDLGDKYNIIWRNRGMDNCEAEEMLREFFNCKRI